MSEIIKRDIIEQIRIQADLKTLVESKTSLKSAGIATWKGLCPFHEEKTPSFVVKPQSKYYHCFGCGEGGDVFKFIMTTESFSFFEAVEFLARKYNINIEYENDFMYSQKKYIVSRQRILKINKAAMQFFKNQLNNVEAKIAKDFLYKKGFNDELIAEHLIGYAPKGWNNLLGYLKIQGFTKYDACSSDLIVESKGRLYDRFRGRLIWPIQDSNNQVLGFGARKIYNNDFGGKYINSSETLTYKKSQTLYGLNIAKKEIFTKKQVILVEGYTDVMAFNAVGLRNVIATCGTALSKEHINAIRRLLSDDLTSEVIFMFDNDKAGYRAALNAFKMEESFLSQTFIVIGKSGLDPCDIRMQYGDKMLSEIVKDKIPLFEFVLRTIFAQHSINTVEQRVHTAKALTPILNKIKNPLIKSSYVHKVSRWLGLSVENIKSEMAMEGNSSKEVYEKSNKRNIISHKINSFIRVEQKILEFAIQHPQIFNQQKNKDLFLKSLFENKEYNKIAQTIKNMLNYGIKDFQWLHVLNKNISKELIPLVNSLALAQIPASNSSELILYGNSLFKRLAELNLEKEKRKIQMDLSFLYYKDNLKKIHELQKALVRIENEKRKLKNEI